MANSPFGGLSQGLRDGFSMGMQLDQARQQRRAQEWERDFRLAGHFMDYAKTKGATPETTANSVNSANQLLQKWYPDMKFPTLTAENVPDYAPVLKAGSELIQGLEKDPSKYEFAVGEWGRHNADWVANAGKSAALSETQDGARKQVTETLKTMGDSHAAKTNSGKAMTPEKVLGEMFDINKSVVGMQQLDQNTANLIQMNPEVAQGLVGARLSPDQIGQVQGIAAARMQALNQLLPEGQRLQEITGEEYKALIAAGHKPEEISRKAFVVQGKSAR